MNNASPVQTSPSSVLHKFAGLTLSLVILAALSLGIARHIGALTCSGEVISEASLPKENASK
jgi:hypothetical protein